MNAYKKTPSVFPAFARMSMVFQLSLLLERTYLSIRLKELVLALIIDSFVLICVARSQNSRHSLFSRF